jgi:hypothetical protein
MCIHITGSGAITPAGSAGIFARTALALTAAQIPAWRPAAGVPGQPTSGSRSPTRPGRTLDIGHGREADR